MSRNNFAPVRHSVTLKLDDSGRPPAPSINPPKIISEDNQQTPPDSAPRTKRSSFSFMRGKINPVNFVETSDEFSSDVPAPRIPYTKHPCLSTFDDEIIEGIPYDKHLRHQREQGFLEISVPETIYTAVALIVSLGSAPSLASSKFQQIVIYGPLYLASAVSACSQAVALYYVFDMNDQKRKEYWSLGVGYCEAEGTALALRMICNAIFFASCVIDLSESWDFYVYLKNIPMRKKEDVPILEELGCGITARRIVVQNLEGVEYSIERVGHGGFTQESYYWAFFCCFTKVCMEVFMLLSGTAYVCYAASNEDLLMNAVALTFISQIDDIAYSFAVTDAFKNIMKTLPKIGFVDECKMTKYQISNTMAWAQILGPWANLLLLFTCAPILRWYVCTVGSPLAARRPSFLNKTLSV